MNRKKKILITGANGYIGSNIEKSLGIKFKIYLLGRKSKQRERVFYLADINDFDAIVDCLNKTRPDIVIHTAALSSLNQCEKNPTLAYKINTGGTKNIVDGIKKINSHIKLIFLSSEYVFDGVKGNYSEKSKPNPKSVYGKSKLKAEKYIKQNLRNYIICRTANVFGKGGKFFNFILESLQQNKQVEVYNNVFYTPTYIGYLIDCLEKLIAEDFKGMINIVGPERISRYQFALKMAEVLNKNRSLIRAVKQPDGGLIAKDSSLNSRHAKNLLKNFCPTVEKSLHYCFGNLISPYFYFEDQRGKFFGVIQKQKWEEVNYIESNKGCVRGNHYHKKTKECFYIIEGKIKVTLINLSDDSKKEFIVNGGDIFIIEPNTAHTFKVLENSKWINMLSRAMNSKAKDIYRYS